MQTSIDSTTTAPRSIWAQWWHEQQTFGRLPVGRQLWWTIRYAVQVLRHRQWRHPYIMDDFCRIFSGLRENPGLWRIAEEWQRQAFAGDPVAMEAIAYVWGTGLLGEAREDLAAGWFREARIISRGESCYSRHSHVCGNKRDR